MTHLDIAMDVSAAVNELQAFRDLQHHGLQLVVAQSSVNYSDHSHVMCLSISSW